MVAFVVTLQRWNSARPRDSKRRIAATEKQTAKHFPVNHDSGNNHEKTHPKHGLRVVIHASNGPDPELPETPGDVDWPV